MPVPLTPELRAALEKQGVSLPDGKKARTTQKADTGPYHTRCCTCREEFTVIKREDEHVQPGHYRFEVVL